MDELDINYNPQHNAHECSPESAGPTVAKIIALVNIPLTINGDDLEKLPEWVNWKMTISLWDIKLEYNKLGVITMICMNISEYDPEVV